ncbi:MAG: hypothetical protein ACI84K_001883 [Pseudohongiellaceae bacterium]|jgi:hypothetical protein
MLFARLKKSIRNNQLNRSGKNMPYFINTILSLFLLLAIPAFAGSGHDHGHGHSHEPITKAEAEEIATKSVTKLVKRKTIDSSWASVSVHKSERKEFGGKMEWVVLFMNEKISDHEKQTLYVFLSSEGQYLAANYTGS